MTAMALAELQARLSPSDFAALQADVAAIVNLTVPQTTAQFNAQKAVLMQGQLKALAKPFYTRLRSWDGNLLNLQMHRSEIRVLEPGAPSPFTYSPFPWSENTSDDSNKSIATVGQLKAVFSLALESWVSPGPYDSAWPTGSVDSDGDGLSDITELAMGTSPILVDTDSDGYPDGYEAFPIDPTRWVQSVAPSGDDTAPVISLIEPVDAVPVP